MEFDPAHYRATYADLAGMDDAQAYEHFLTYGFDEGRTPSAGAAKESFIRQIPRDGLTLEIGPFANPALVWSQVRYADMLSTEELRERALVHQLDPEKCPKIDYVLSRLPLEQIPDRFRSVFSSHCIEHQPDLVAHLQGVSRLLEGGGSYFLVCPDKRYCFDHFLPETTIADVLVAYAERRTRHSLRSWIAYAALTTHNDMSRHWRGDHGVRVCETHGDTVLQGAMQAYSEAEEKGEYLDCHAWQFTPATFEVIFEQLFRLGLTDLAPSKVYRTLRNRNEFCVVLRKRGATPA